MFNPRAFHNSRPDGIAVLEVVGKEEEGGAPRLFVPLKRTQLSGEVAGPLAALRVTHTYGYSKGQCPEVIEAVYRFPLPGDAAVTGVTVRFGEVVVRATLKAREQAEADYKAAKRQRRQAALVTRESPDVFTLQVAGLQPDQEVAVETTYVQLARADGPGWSLRIPLTTSPRYVRSDEVNSRHAHGQPLALLRDPGHRFALDLRLRGAGAVESDTHRLAVSQEEGGMRVALQGDEVVPDRDCILSWRPQQGEVSPSAHLYLYDDEAGRQVYFLAHVAPPALAVAKEGPRREVILLVDHSGSMEGPKWEAADWAVEQFLSGLGAGDAFGLGLFHNTTRWLARAPRKAGAKAIQEAVHFLKAHRDSGGTELGVALEQALSMPRTKGPFARHVLIATDAEVSDAGRILRLADQETIEPDRRRISVLCIDAAPNAYLATSLAERGGGVARFLTSDPEEGDISTALDEVLADWAQPILAGLRLEVNRPGVQAAGRQVVGARELGWQAVDLGDLPTGRTVWVAGRVPRGDGGDLSFRASGEGQELGLGPVVLAADGAGAALKALFGAWRVAGLEYLIQGAYGPEELDEHLLRLGYDPERDLARRGARAKVYAENARGESEKALRELLAREALDYGLASSETAFVAVRSERGQAVQATVAVANALPAGWSESFLAAPAMGVRASGMAHYRLASPPPMAAPPSVRADLSVPPAAGMRSMASEEAGAASQRAAAEVIFSGVAATVRGEAVLFDSDRRQDAGRLPVALRLAWLGLRYVGSGPKAIDPGLELLIFVDDMAEARARVRLSDLERHGGGRPLNVTRRLGERLLITLQDPNGVWASGAPHIELAVRLE